VSSTAVVGFTRYRVTWLAYLMLGTVGYVINGVGPALPGLRADLGIDYAMTSLHGSVYALGLIAAGIAGDRVARRLGRRLALWLAAGGMEMGVVLLALAPSLMVSLPAALVIGIFAGLLLVLVPAILSDRHGARRDAAYAESNAFASGMGAIAPLMIAASILAGATWRAGLTIPPAVLLIGLAVAFGTTRIPTGGTPHPGDDGNGDARMADRPRGDSRQPAVDRTLPGRPAPSQLPSAYWRHWLTLVLVVGVEWCFIYWAAAYLGAGRVVGPGLAAASLAPFLGGMVIGRAAGGHLVLRIRAGHLLLASLGLAALGFVVFWGVGLYAAAIVGLFLAGLGVALLYPLTLGMAVAEAPEASDLASARATLGSGLAITVAPFVLGWTADRVGLRIAFLVVPILIALAAVSFRIATTRRSGG